MSRHFTVMFLIAVCGSACGGSSTSQSSVVRDSAGITIIDNASPLWTDSAAAWRMDETPSLEIGVVEGAPEYQFSGIRRALRLPNGEFLIADGGSRELRFYDAGGNHLRSSGRAGEGPGEFRVISLLERYGTDSL